MIEVKNTDVNIVRNLIPMRNFMPASAYGLKAISDWLLMSFVTIENGIPHACIENSMLYRVTGISLFFLI